jgi:hypothetical protein
VESGGNSDVFSPATLANPRLLSAKMSPVFFVPNPPHVRCYPFRLAPPRKTSDAYTY